MNKLLTPGPVYVPEFVLEAIQRPVIHHRSPAFREFYQGFLDKLSYLFQAKTVGSMIGSGTYGVASLIYSLFRKGEKVVVANNGKFSGRWVNEARHLGLQTIELEAEWGHGMEVQTIMDALAKEKGVNGLLLTHSETSTGTILDLEEIAFQVKQHHPDALILVDGITSVGAMPYYHDLWGIDVSITASQKALMNPAGTVAFALSAAAVAKLAPTHQGDFRNAFNYLKAIENKTYPYTAPVQLLYGLDAALTYIKQKGLPVIWNRCHQSSKLFRHRLKEMGGNLFSKYPTDSLTAFSFEGKSMEELKEKLEEGFGWVVSSGQGKLKDKILRISHMGTSDKAIMEQFCTDLEKLL